jgi:hypothetical protein
MRPLAIAGMLLLVSTNAFGEATVDAMRSQLWQKPDDNITVYGNYMPGPTDRKPGVRTPFDLNADPNRAAEPGGGGSPGGAVASLTTEPETRPDSTPVVDILKNAAVRAYVRYLIATRFVSVPTSALLVLAAWPVEAE